jgi:hypothetical protein
MAKIAAKEIKKLKVGNCEIEIGQIYMLDHKLDGTAPDGLKKIEATKYPFTGSGVMDCVYFDEDKNLYDTGFYTNSYSLGAYSQEEKEEWVNVYKKQIQEPFEKLRNTQLEPNKSNDFWKEYRYEAYVNKEFKTNDPTELFELFQIIMQGVACNKNEKNPFYRGNAQFTISNPQMVKNKNKERSKLRLQAIKKLSILADSDKDKLDLVLQFTGREDTTKVSAEDLESMYFEVFNDRSTGVDVAERFLDACKEYETEQGRTKMEFFHILKKLLGLRKIKKDRRGFITEAGVFLGITLQEAAVFCLKTDSSQYKAVDSLIDENPTVRRVVE